MLTALAARAGVTRSTVHEALWRLEAFGLIERTRRVEPRAMMLNGRRIGTTYEQTSNAYRLGPPRRVSLLRHVPPKAAELWDRWVKAWEEMLKDVADLLRTSASDYPTESTPLVLSNSGQRPQSPLDSALDRLGDAIRRSMESVAQGNAYGGPPLAAHS